jgi:hypothetical protein
MLAMRTLFLSLFLIASAWGQGVIPIKFTPFQQIRAYLGLTDEQVAKMQQQIDDYYRWADGRQQRMSAVQREIAEETAKNPLDPMALGVRYAEVEAIRRELAERSAALIPANVAFLTDAQKVKLKALEEALKLASTGAEAQTLRLLPPQCALAGIFGLPSGVPVLVDRGPNLCNGDFSAIFAP